MQNFERDRVQDGVRSDRRASLFKFAVAGVGLGIKSASAAEVEQVKAEPKPKFKRIPRIQFVAALGDPAASSGTGAEEWGLWDQDPGPRGVTLGKYPKLDQNKGKSPRGGNLTKATGVLRNTALLWRRLENFPPKSSFVKENTPLTGLNMWFLVIVK